MKRNFKRSSKAILTLVFCLFVGMNLQAQQRGQQGGQQGPPQMPDSTQIVKIVKELKTNLSLSDTQYTKVYNLYVAHFDEAKTLLAQNKDDRDNLRTKMDNLKQKFEKQVKAELTKEQQTKFAAIMEKQAPPQGQGRPERQ